MKHSLLLFSTFAVQLYANVSFDELRKQYINNNRCCILEGIEVANKNRGFAIPKPELEKSARELKAKGLELFLSDNDECAYYPHEDRCLLYNHIVRFLNMTKDEAITEIKSLIEKGIADAAWEEKWRENPHDSEMVDESQNRFDAIKKGITLLQEFLELAEKAETRNISPTLACGHLS